MYIPNNNNTEVKRQAQWNAGALTSFRINCLVIAANQHSINNELTEWCDVIDCIYREAHSKATKTEREAYAQWKQKLQSYIMEYDRYKRSSDHNKKWLATSKLKEQLSQYEMAVRDILDGHGLMMPDKDDPRFAAGKTGI